MSLFDAEKFKGKRVIVAFSGGIDSVCLLHAFREQAAALSISLSALHIEHGIRGEESLRDMEFCRALCKAWEIPLEIERFDVPKLAAAWGKGLEETARGVRYGAFHTRLERGDADCIATAHHLDDVAETVLFRLARGTGPAGMRAITEFEGIVRPLLSVTRAEIEAYAAQKNLPHVDDSTNEDENYTRNYIRKTVLPAFEKIHGNAKKHLAEFAALVAEDDAFLRRKAREAIVHAAGEEWVPVALPDALFFRACLVCMRRSAPEEGFARANLEEIAKLRTAQSGKRVVVPMAYDAHGTVKRYAFREGDHIVFDFVVTGDREPAELPFTADAGSCLAPIPFLVEEVEGLPARTPRTKDGARRLIVDLDAFPAGCVVRTRREGDMFTPCNGPRKALKKFLTDRKISARLGHKLPVIARGSEIYAIVGVELADSVKVTEQTVRQGSIRFLD